MRRGGCWLLFQGAGLRPYGPWVLQRSHNGAARDWDGSEQSARGPTEPLDLAGGNSDLKEDAADNARAGAALLVFTNAREGPGLHELGPSESIEEIEKVVGNNVITKHFPTMQPKFMIIGKGLLLTDIKSDMPYAGLGFSGVGDAHDPLEDMDLTKENIRWGIAAACHQLHRIGSIVRFVDVDNRPEAVGEAVTLVDWSLKVDACAVPPTGIPTGLGDESGMQVLAPGDSSSYLEQFKKGQLLGRAQNWARFLSDMPANFMTPLGVAKAALDVLCPLGVKVTAHDRDWIVSQRMQAFLAVASGSCEPPVFLECYYQGAGATDKPVLLTAKGVTFDSGGLCLKRPTGMVENRGSMSGAAVVLAALKALAELKVKLNVAAVIPLCENMISGTCMKVGDVVCALNGKTIQIDNTDMEGRLMLADAMVYGQAVYKPSILVNVATLTSGVEEATGGAAFGCYASTEELWRGVKEAGSYTGDRAWRLPLWNYYHRQITDETSVDLQSKGFGIASSCIGAAFLKEFICGDFVHMDTTGVGKLGHAYAPPYLDPRRMTGRPTRTLIKFLENFQA